MQTAYNEATQKALVDYLDQHTDLPISLMYGVAAQGQPFCQVEYDLIGDPFVVVNGQYIPDVRAEGNKVFIKDLQEWDKIDIYYCFGYPVLL